MSTTTPRTEAMRIMVTDNDTCKIKVLETVHASFARTLERELTALTAERDLLRERAERADAELAAERSRLDWVFRNCKVEADDFTTGNRDVYAIHDREDLRAAMKEDAK